MKDVPTKEVAKQVKKDLKLLYPQIKFSITSDSNKIIATYKDGAKKSDVEAVIKKYHGYGDWDSNYCDYNSHKPVLFQGEMQNTYLMYFSVTRKFSPEFLQEVIEFVKGKSCERQSDNIEVKLHGDSTAFLSCEDRSRLATYIDILHRCDAFSPIAEQEEKLRQEQVAPPGEKLQIEQTGSNIVQFPIRKQAN